MENTMSNGTINATEAINAKASAILKARFPHLTEARLNFEKRTGNFFLASMVAQEDGTEKLTRKVVEDDNIAEVCHEEMKQKRAGAFVLAYADKVATADANIAKAEEALAEAKAYKAQLATEYTEACAVVEACELPEKAERVTLTATVEAQKSEIERLKALLASAGIEA